MPEVPKRAVWFFASGCRNMIDESGRYAAAWGVRGAAGLRARRNGVMDVKHEASLVGELLQLDLPQPDARSIRAAASMPTSSTQDSRSRAQKQRNVHRHEGNAIGSQAEKAS
jgi:hypothetical protein